MQLSKSSIYTIVAVVFAFLLAVVPVTDEVGENYIDASFKRALVSFAVARGLNGVISVAQGTEVAVQPAGVGINFSPGEILDPVNDLIERFSWVMLLATSSLGVQKVLLSMSAWHGLLLALLLMTVLVVVSHVFLKSERLRAAFARVFLFLLILRFMMPAIAIGNNWVYETFLQSDYLEATAELQTAQQEIGSINRSTQSTVPSESSGFVDKARGLYKQVVENVDIEKRFEQYKIAASSISENAIQLIVVFIMQTIVFPLIFLSIVFGVVRRLTRWGSS